MATLDLLPADLQLVQTLLERSVDSVGGQGVDVKVGACVLHEPARACVLVCVCVCMRA